MICNAALTDYIDAVTRGEIPACREQRLLVDYVRRCFELENIRLDETLLSRYLRFARYFPFDSLFPWERFCLALHLCTFWRESQNPRWPDLFLMIGRGAGKDSFIAFESFCLLSPASGLARYDVDICACVEEQAMRPVQDVISVLRDPSNFSKLSKHFAATAEKVTGRKFGGVLRGRTNNPRSRDGMRSGMVVFNEIHSYENYANIKVFISGQGKTVDAPRRLYVTTNGDVRGGPLDELLERSEAVLSGAEPDRGFLPFLCRLDAKEEAHDPALWPKANPSLPFFPVLMDTVKKEYEEWKLNPVAGADFMTKRMNIPQSDQDIAVTSWENVAATNRALPDLSGFSCVVGVDFSSISDLASVAVLFRSGDERFVMSHSWLCLRSRDLHRIRAPWRDWASLGLLTLVDEVEIAPELICRYIEKLSGSYAVLCVAIDSYRFALMNRALSSIGFSTDNKSVVLVRPSDVMRVHPVIDSVFLNQRFVWGDNPVLRWACGNTKTVRSSRKLGVDTGNCVYAKIEGKSRKTDPFMALVAAMCVEDRLSVSNVSWGDFHVVVG